MAIDKDDLNTRFTYQRPTEDTIPKFEVLRNTGKAFAELIVECCPPSREQSLAITKLEEVIFWANASIARKK